MIFCTYLLPLAIFVKKILIKKSYIIYFSCKIIYCLCKGDIYIIFSPWNRPYIFFWSGLELRLMYIIIAISFSKCKSAMIFSVWWCLKLIYSYSYYIGISEKKMLVATSDKKETLYASDNLLHILEN